MSNKATITSGAFKFSGNATVSNTIVLTITNGELQISEAARLALESAGYNIIRTRSVLATLGS